MTEQKNTIYLDYNALAPIAPECMDAALECMRWGIGNASSKHHAGERAKYFMIEARAQVAALLGAQTAEIVFTSGGTESIHTAIYGALALAPHKRHLVTSRVEHPATLQLLKHLEAQGTRVTYLPVDTQGRIDVRQLQQAITPDTALVSLMWANNETGVVFPIAEIAAICNAHKVLLHCDAVQAAGKLPINVQQVKVDLLSVSGHKLHAPPGIGALFVRKGLKLPPLLFGQQERARRGGTANVPGIAALGVACLLAFDTVPLGVTQIAERRDRLERGIVARFPFARVNGGAAERVANTTNIRFGELDAEALLLKLDGAGICAAQGAACSAGGAEPSHVLTAMGLDAQAAQASIRFSVGRYTRNDEIDTVLEILPQIVASLVADAA
ncbi:MAG: aminotransferase class V-fold PLP-dependent enzyme [Pseudomonadota bacterium]